MVLPLDEEKESFVLLVPKMRLATIVGSKGGKFTSVSVGNANDVKKEFKKGKFPQFDKVVFFDSSGGLIRKRGQAQAKAEAKAEPKK